MSPEDALAAMDMLRAKRMVPIHWGAFRLSLEPMGEPTRRPEDVLKKRGLNPRVVLLQPGEKTQI